MSVGLLFDATRCIGCGACSAACKEKNGLPLPIEDVMTAYTWTTVQPAGGTFIRRLCMHCLEPTCVSVCPVAALAKTPEGAVAYDPGRCIGCRYCIQACPFSVPKFQWDRLAPLVGKCDLCLDRVKAGRPTACAAVCPTGATLFGDREALVREGRARIQADPGTYVDHVYGVDEAGGTSVLMLAGVPFERLGIRTDLPRQSLPMLTWNVLSKIPDLVVMAGALLYGLHWITKRRVEVQGASGGGPPAAGAAEAPGRRRRFRWLPARRSAP